MTRQVSQSLLLPSLDKASLRSIQYSIQRAISTSRTPSASRRFSATCRKCKLFPCAVSKSLASRTSLTSRVHHTILRNKIFGTKPTFNTHCFGFLYIILHTHDLRRVSFIHSSVLANRSTSIRQVGFQPPKVHYLFA